MVSGANERSPSPAMSENYVVFIEQPIKLDLLKFMLYKIQGKSFHRIMCWEPQYGTVFHVVNRHTGEVGRPVQPNGNILYLSTQTLKLKLISNSERLFLISLYEAFPSYMTAFSLQLITQNAH